MNILFEFPLAFTALSSLAIVTAIYLLRNRFRQFYVSSLMLWTDQRQHKQGGLNLDRLQTPLLFILELLILLLLSLAAAGPLLRSKSDLRRMVIVLDDSFSMQAGTETTCRDTAIRELKRYLKASEPFRVTFILAGRQPSVLARDVSSSGEAAALFDDWRCYSPSADLDKAIAMAGELADQKARILVISDHPVDTIKQDSPLEYWSLGKPLDNAGFLFAGRTRTDGRDRCMLIVGNFSYDPRTVTLTITSLDGKTAVYEKTITITPDEPFQMIFEPPADMDLAATISADALAIDNRAILLKTEDKQVRIAVDIKDADLSASIVKAIDAIPAARRVTEFLDLAILDTAQPEAGTPSLWTLQIQSASETSAFVGPFIADRNHPLTEGLNLEGIIWSAGSTQSRNVPIISAGNTPLLEEEQDTSSGRRLRLYLNPELSTLAHSPNWPILFWNLIHWRQASLAGLPHSNYRLGSQILVEVPPACLKAQLDGPDGHRTIYDRPAAGLALNADLPGCYQLTMDTKQYAFAVNAVSAAESDLRGCQIEQKENPNQASLFWWEYRPWDGVLLLIAIVLLTLHQYVIFSQARGGKA